MKEANIELEKLTAVANENSAVTDCARAWILAYSRARLRDQSNACAKEQARMAYRLAMPTLTAGKDARDFVACVTFGIVLETIRPDEGSKLLYAAQVANSASRSSEVNKTSKQKSSSGRDGHSLTPPVKNTRSTTLTHPLPARNEPENVGSSVVNYS